MYGIELIKWIVDEIERGEHWFIEKREENSLL